MSEINKPKVTHQNTAYTIRIIASYDPFFCCDNHKLQEKVGGKWVDICEDAFGVRIPKWVERFQLWPKKEPNP